jgi:hypothetical protein
LVTQLAPGESAHVIAKVKFAAVPNGDALVTVYGRPSGEDWPTEPRDMFRIVTYADSLRGIDFPVGGLGMYEFRVGLLRDSLGATDLVSGFLSVQRDGVDLTTPLE